MSKKKNGLADKILEYIRRNEREQEPPPGYKSISEWMVELNCTKRKWNIILPCLLKSGHVKSVKLRRVSKQGKICIYNYYSIDKKFLDAACK